MKRLLPKLTVILLMLIAAIVTFAACDGKGGITGISVKTNPQTIYVLGQELNLDGGVLTVQDGDEFKQIPLNAEGVTVTGYDKNKLGSQELTVEYKGKSATLTVNVVPRMIAENADTDYFVGESLNRSKGRLRITRNDGTNFTVNLSSEQITISSFDSSAASSSVTVSVHYAGGSESYDGTFSVAVHEIQTVSLTRPNKLSYGSHESGIDLSGGYLTITDASGKISKHVELAESMIEGFDLSVVSIDHKTEEQTVTVRAFNRTLTFPITVNFSNVSLIRQRIEELSSLDWTGSAPPSYTEEQGAVAFEAVTLYLALSYDDKAYIQTTGIENLARLASVYGLEKWNAAAKTYPGLFDFKDGEVFFSPATYAGVKADYEKLLVDDQPIFNLAANLDDVQDQFSEVKIIGDVTIGYYLSHRYSSYGLHDLLPMLQYMLTLHEALAAVPENWERSQLPSYREHIDRAHSYLANTRYTDLAYRYIYDYVSSWRTKNDYFEIVYTYCCYHPDGEISARDTVNKIKNIHLYGDLERLFNIIYEAILQLNFIYEGDVIDSTQFLYLYNEAVNLAGELSHSDDPMYRELINLSFGNLLTSNNQPVEVSFAELINFLRTDAPGYIYFNHGLLGDGEFTALLNEYVALFTKIRTVADYFNSDEYEADVAKLFKSFAETSPTRQYNFLAAINAYYDRDFPELALDYSQVYYSYFTAFIGNHYEGVLPQSTLPVFRNLLLALEYTAQYSQESMKNFDEIMADVAKSYGEMNAVDKAKFNEHVDFLYERYISLYNSRKAESPEVGEEYESKISKLREAITYVFFVEDTFISGRGIPMYTAVFAAYEKAQIIADDILENAPEEVLYNYYHENYLIQWGETSGFYSTLDFAMYYARSIYISHLTELSINLDNTYMLYDLYSRSDLQSFMSDAFYVVFAYIFTDTTDEDAETQFSDTEQVKQAMKSFRELDAFDKILFLTMDANMELYRNGLRQFFRENFTDDGYSAATLLLSIEDYYTDFSYYPDDSYEAADGTTRTYRQDFTENMEKLIGAYAKLTGADKEAFDSYLYDTYAYYLGIYENLD